MRQLGKVQKSKLSHGPFLVDFPAHFLKIHQLPPWNLKKTIAFLSWRFPASKASTKQRWNFSSGVYFGSFLQEAPCAYCWWRMGPILFNPTTWQKQLQHIRCKKRWTCSKPTHRKEWLHPLNVGIETPLGLPKNLGSQWVNNAKQSIHLYAGYPTNLHELHCCSV